uniref:Uncharacterized protein n=1 Tax=Nelumbo nucifera TaxID=4432 RepID=A0A822XI54_NELNU|nr:TPA_asm: hypothetical protein HUJ06_021370 [Nelumbo nucifera]
MKVFRNRKIRLWCLNIMACDDEIHPYNVTHNHRNTIFQVADAPEDLDDTTPESANDPSRREETPWRVVPREGFPEDRMRWLKLQY